MKSSYNLQLNINQLDRASELAFRDTAFLLGRKFTEVISEPRQWQGWSGARDIVDTGQLRASQQLVFTKPLEAVYSWSTEYAVYVHEGYTLRNGREVSGRPWTQTAIQEFDVQGTFERRYRQAI